MSGDSFNGEKVVGVSEEEVAEATSKDSNPGNDVLRWFNLGRIVGYIYGYRQGRSGSSLILGLPSRGAACAISQFLLRDKAPLPRGSRDAIESVVEHRTSLLSPEDGADDTVEKGGGVAASHVDLGMSVSNKIAAMGLLARLFFRRNSVGGIGSGVTEDDLVNNLIKWERFKDRSKIAGGLLAGLSLLVPGWILRGCVADNDDRDSMDSTKIEAEAYLDSKSTLIISPEEPITLNTDTVVINLASGERVKLEKPHVGQGLSLPEADSKKGEFPSWLPQIPVGSPEGSQWAVGQLKGALVAVLLLPDAWSRKPAVAGFVKECPDYGQSVYFVDKEGRGQLATVGALTPLATDANGQPASPPSRDSC